jgi:hypothetical protein
MEKMKQGILDFIKTMQNFRNRIEQDRSKQKSANYLNTVVKIENL